jgi:hypothetical protein
MSTITKGRIVSYKLTQMDADQINRRRIDKEEIQKQMFLGYWTEGVQAHVGEVAMAGEELPMIITKVVEQSSDMGPLSPAISGQVFLNGNDTLFVTGRYEGEGNGNWSWFPRRFEDVVGRA